MSFSTTYIPIKEVSAIGSPIKISQVKNRYNEKIIMISRIIKKEHFQNENHFMQYVRTKHLNIFDPFEYFIRENEYVLVFKDYTQYRFPEQNLYQFDEKLLNIMLFQLAIILQDFQEKKIIWNIFSISQLYLMDQKNVFLSMIDFQDNYFKKNYNNFDGFICLVKQIADQKKSFQSLLSKNKFKEVIHELQASLTEPQFSISNQQDPQELLIMHLYFKLVQEEREQAGDYKIINIQTPNLFKTIFDVKQEQIQFRYYSFKNFGTQQEINQDRELEYQCLLSNSAHVEKIICYVKIYDRVGFFYKKPFSSLKKAFDKKEYMNNQNEKQIYKKICYKIVNDLLKGIKHLHQHNIIHRNLSPETCFLTNKDLDEYNTYFIGQIGTSKKQNNIQVGVIQTSENCQLFDYFMPPEDISKYSDKTDFFLFGLLALYVMNQGQRLFKYSQFGKKDFKENFSPQNIKQQLQDYNYDQLLINVVSKCLEFEPDKRPSIDEIQQIVYNLDQSQKIRPIIIQQQVGGQNF